MIHVSIAACFAVCGFRDDCDAAVVAAVLFFVIINRRRSERFGAQIADYLVLIFDAQILAHPAEHHVALFGLVGQPVGGIGFDTIHDRLAQPVRLLLVVTHHFRRRHARSLFTRKGSGPAECEQRQACHRSRQGECAMRGGKTTTRYRGNLHKTETEYNQRPGLYDKQESWRISAAGRANHAAAAARGRLRQSRSKLIDGPSRGRHPVSGTQRMSTTQSPSSSHSDRSGGRLLQLLPLAGLVIALVALGLSIALACKHEGLCTGGTACLIGNVDGCAELGKSPHSRVFGTGLHIAWLGVFYYAFVTLLFLALLLQRGRDGAQQTFARIVTLLTAVVVFGVVCDLFLAYVNFTVLDVPCLFCLYTYLCQLAILVAVVLLYTRTHRDEAAGFGEMFRGLQAAWWAPLGALVIALLTFIALPAIYGTGSPNAGGDGGPASLDTQVASAERRAQLLRELRAFNTADLSTAGLQNYDGEDQAYIILHDWADFRCPHCLHAHEIIQAAQRRWPGRIKVYYRHFPLDQTCNPLVSRAAGGFSCNGAQAALCAPRNIFPEFYHGVFEFQNAQIPIIPDQLRRLTESLGGDWSAMVGCMGSAKTAAALQRDIKEAEVINVQSTPTIVVDGHILPPGTPRPEFFLGLMDALVIEKEGDAAIQDFDLRLGASGR